MKITPKFTYVYLIFGILITIVFIILYFFLVSKDKDNAKKEIVINYLIPVDSNNIHKDSLFLTANNSEQLLKMGLVSGDTINTSVVAGIVFSSKNYIFKSQQSLIETKYSDVNDHSRFVNLILYSILILVMSAMLLLSIFYVKFRKNTVADIKNPEESQRLPIDREIEKENDESLIEILKKTYNKNSLMLPSYNLISNDIELAINLKSVLKKSGRDEKEIADIMKHFSEFLSGRNEDDPIDKYDFAIFSRYKNLFNKFQSYTGHNISQQYKIWLEDLFEFCFVMHDYLLFKNKWINYHPANNANLEMVLNGEKDVNKFSFMARKEYNLNPEEIENGFHNVKKLFDSLEVKNYKRSLIFGVYYGKDN